ncbi:MAG: hypothetical protein AAGB24_15030 [Bacteroidota bacterium]
MKANKKNRFLIVSILIMCLVSYRFAIKKTIALGEQYRNNLAKKELVKNLPRQLTLMTQKEQFLDAQLTKLSAGNSSMQNNLLKFLNNEAEKNEVKIIEFNAPHIFENGDATLETHMFKVEGGYTDILKTLNTMENLTSFGSINHLGFEKKKDYRSKRTYLQAKVFLQQIR